jgi:signal transduction histidine kinase
VTIPHRPFDQFKAFAQGPRLLQLCLYGIAGTTFTIFLGNYPANLPLWRFWGTEICLVFLVVLNTVRIGRFGSAKINSGLEWIGFVLSSATVLTTVWMSGQESVAYILSFVCILAYFKKGVWPEGLSFGLANLAAWFAFQVAMGGAPWAIVGREFSLAVGVLFGALMASLILKLQAANRELEATRKQERDLAIAEERVRLARELHDSVTQSLYAMTLYAEAATEQLSYGDAETAARHLSELRDTAQDALREMRLLIFELHRPALESGGLAGALQARLDAVEARGGMHAELLIEGTEKLTRAAQGELYGITREALNNAFKHSRAKNIRVRLRFVESGAQLEVCDDGEGFDPCEDRGGMGIAGMKARAQKAGGTLSIQSTPGRGTTVSVRVSGTLLARNTAKAEGKGK